MKATQVSALIIELKKIFGEPEITATVNDGETYMWDGSLTLWEDKAHLGYGRELGIHAWSVDVAEVVNRELEKYTTIRVVAGEVKEIDIEEETLWDTAQDNVQLEHTEPSDTVAQEQGGVV